MKKFISIGLLLSSFYLWAQKQDKKIQQIADVSPLPGFAISIVTADEVVLNKAYGYANKANKVNYEPSNAQLIASVSKTFIGVSLMKCNELGIIDLDTDINEVLPFKVLNPNFPEEKITARQIATHTSSIVDNIPDHFKVYFNENPNVEGASFDKRTKKQIDEALRNELIPLTDILASIFVEGETQYSKKNFLNKAPGTTYRYSNTAGSLAALMIEQASGMSYESFVSEYILEPLEMNNSSFDPTKIPEQNRTVLYTGSELIPAPTYTSRLFPIGGLYTSINDLSRYLMEMINGYAGNGTILSKESYTVLFEKQFTTLPDKHPSNESNQGIFWTFRGGLIGHTGGGLGASSFLFFNPETGIGKIFITNCELESNKDFVPTFQQVWTEMSEIEKAVSNQ